MRSCRLFNKFCIEAVVLFVSIFVAMGVIGTGVLVPKYFVALFAVEVAILFADFSSLLCANAAVGAISSAAKATRRRTPLLRLIVFIVWRCLCNYL